MPLTDTTARTSKPGVKPIRLFDAGGLYLEVSPKGGKWWRLKYRFDGKEKRLSLGTYPDTGLKAARASRDEARKLLADGVDPGALRKATKAADSALISDTFEAVAREWYDKAYANKAESTREKTMTRLVQDVFPIIGHMPVASIEPAHIRAVIELIEQRGALDIAKRVFNYVGRTLRYADSFGKVTRDVSASIDLNLILPERDTKHHAALTDPAAVGGLMRAIHGFSGGFVTVCALKLSALTFVRPGELRHPAERKSEQTA